MRALLAFRGLERDEHGSFTEECELGAELELARLNALIDIKEMILAYFEGVAKASRRPRNG